jgi:isoleucyl-tRNA synthetase
MPRFEDFSRSILLAKEEERTLAFWKEADIFRRSLEHRKDAPRFVFYEGPPTANGRPGIHHVLGRTIKDLVCRYQAMKGHLVERKSGWDTHGLPVELEVEKKLGIQGKEQIEAYGLEKFNQMCKESVFTYKDEWERMTDRIAFWLDLEHPYVTLENDYIESVWWVLRKFWDQGLVYEGFKILPYCPRCETPLSSHEVSQGYNEVEDPSVFVKFETVDEPGVFLLAWTTTPWTLISNVALAVSPDETYVRVRLKPRLNKDGTPKSDTGHQAGETLILAKARLEQSLYGPYEILEEFPGRTLHEKRYKPLFGYFANEPAAFRVLTADFVSMDDGTGIVHSAPAFGEDDYRMGKIYGLPTVRPVNRRGEFTEEITDYAGTFVKKADPAIIENLKARGSLYAAGTMTHSYPFCWRCDTPLIYYARDSWYLKTTAFRDVMVEVNNGIKWFPPEAGEKRFGDWLRNNIDWAISRDRYWGTPLPIWRCAACGTTDMIGGRPDLKARGAVFPDDLDLHRPYIDRITFPCRKCGETATRVPEVIDVWFDSGAMPFAQWHYPFENEKHFEAMFPADFISEGIDQSRGWFYSLLAISVAVTRKAPYRSVVVNDLVLDAQGQKMSKHKGNTVNPWELLESEGADAVRWYLMVNSPPWLPTRFSKEGVTEVARKFFGTLRNVASFFAVYANVDGWAPGVAPPVAASDRPLIDRWLLSRLEGLIETVDRQLALYDVTRAARAIQDFVLDELSNWYVRRNRRRFWKGGTGPDKEAAYATLYTTLKTLAGLVAPVAPFVSEEIHQKIVRPAEPDGPISIHMTDFPVLGAHRRDPALEEAMAAAMEIVEAGRAARNAASLKVRQPLAALLVAGGGEAASRAVETLDEIIADELNVRQVRVEEGGRLFQIELKPHFKTMGPAFGRDVNQVAGVIRSLHDEAKSRLASGHGVAANVDGREITVLPEHVEVVRHPRTGLSVVEQGGLVVALETALTPELMAEGQVRELVHRLQSLRKEQGLAVTDRIHVEYCASPNLEKAVEAHKDLIMAETLARSLLKVAGTSAPMTDWDLDGENFQVSIRPVSAEL